MEVYQKLLSSAANREKMQKHNRHCRVNIHIWWNLCIIIAISLSKQTSVCL